MASFVRQFHIKTPALWQRHFLGKRMTITKDIYNALRNIEIKKLNQLENDSLYSSIIKKEYKTWTKEDYLIIKKLRKEYKITRFDFIKDVKPIYKFFKDGYSSQMAQSVAKRLWNSFDRYFYGDGESIHEMKSCNSFESESNTNGIIFDGKSIRVLKRVFDVEIPEDEYTKEVLEHKVSYCRIIKMVGKTQDRYYIQVVFEGYPPKKEKQMTTGNVGIDIGTSTVAISSNSKVYIDELAKEVKPIKKELRRIDRKLERSRRKTNPKNYDSKGQIINKKYHWYKSHNYKKLARKKRYLNQKIKRKRKESHEILSNMILKLGDSFHIEQMKFNNLQKRKTKTEIDEKGRYKKKKQFGSSINTHAPSEFVTILKRKARNYNLTIDEVDTYIVKASQYNHYTKQYEKKELSVRRFFVGAHEVQRDLYSAFLLMNVSDNQINQLKCEENFNNYIKLQTIEINRLQKQKNISCIGY